MYWNRISGCSPSGRKKIINALPGVETPGYGRRVPSGTNSANLKVQAYGVSNDRNSGFTLLEVMVCIAIIAIVLVATLRLHAQTIQMSGASKFYTTAPLLAQQKLADIDSNPDDNLFDGSGGFGDDFSDYRWQITVSPVENGVLGETAERLKCIDITVSYKNGEAVFHSKAYRIVNAK